MTMEPIKVYPDRLYGVEIPQPATSRRFAYVYMHGEAEGRSGFDCCNMDRLPEEAGHHPAVVVWPDGTEDPATLHYCPKDQGQRGLVTLDSDAQGTLEARSWYDRANK